MNNILDHIPLSKLFIKNKESFFGVLEFDTIIDTF